MTVRAHSEHGRRYQKYGNASWLYSHPITTDQYKDIYCDAIERPVLLVIDLRFNEKKQSRDSSLRAIIDDLSRAMPSAFLYSAARTIMFYVDAPCFRLVTHSFL